MTTTSVTDADEGKRVVDTNGDTVGVVSGVRDGRAYVDPDPGITDTVKAKLGWEDVDVDDYPLDDSRIETVTEDEIRLKGMD